MPARDARRPARTVDRRAGRRQRPGGPWSTGGATSGTSAGLAVAVSFPAVNAYAKENYPCQDDRTADRRPNRAISPTGERHQEDDEEQDAKPGDGDPESTEDDRPGASHGPSVARNQGFGADAPSGSRALAPTGTSALSGEALEEQPDRFCELGVVHLDRHSVRTWFDRNGLFAFGITDEDFAG